MYGFIRAGARLFSPDDWHRAPFQFLLYLFLWAAAIRVAVTDQTPIPFEQLGGPWVYHAWLATNLTAPLVSALSWWLITRSRIPRSTLVGIWLRLGADLAMFGALLSYHLARMAVTPDHEVFLVARYLTGAVLAFLVLLVVRDVWTIVATVRVSRRMR